jgi:hypothetical protein
MRIRKEVALPHPLFFVYKRLELLSAVGEHGSLFQGRAAQIWNKAL